MPLVTAAIPTYNRARYVGEAIESVLAQTYRDLDVLVVDDGSTDETPEVAGRYGDRIRYLRQENRGRSAARNAAVEAARGELIAFCDSDDRWLPDKVERQVAALRDGVGMVHGHIEAIDPEGRVLPEETEFHQRLFREAHRGGVTYAGYAWECRCFSSTVLIRAEAFERVGLYDTSLLLDDYDLYLRLALEYEILFLDERPLSQYRLHPEQMTAYELTTGQIQTAEKHLRILDRRDGVPDERRARRNFNLMLARSHRVLGDRRAARGPAVRAAALGAPKALRFLL
jgi:glycosyltransferase involved in cell wall biosynthesis